MQGWEIPENTHLPVASSNTNPICKNRGATAPGIEPGRKGRWLVTRMAPYRKRDYAHPESVDSGWPQSSSGPRVVCCLLLQPTVSLTTVRRGVVMPSVARDSLKITPPPLKAEIFPLTIARARKTSQTVSFELGIPSCHMDLILLTYSPPTKASLVLFRAESLYGFPHARIVPDSAAGGRGLSSRISRFPFSRDSGNALCSPSFTLIGSQDTIPSNRRQASREVISGREICDYEHQAVKSTAGRLDYSTKCTSTPHELRYAPQAFIYFRRQQKGGKEHVFWSTSDKYLGVVFIAVVSCEGQCNSLLRLGRVDEKLPSAHPHHPYQYLSLPLSITSPRPPQSRICSEGRRLHVEATQAVKSIAPEALKTAVHAGFGTD
ncbi:hypothetical protein PR048_030312 [Dryococelus australis]|uniref:Uncharacterized protein n=1 Tax=Dryococelus australis TaxID=614101 RepID=A0ABQ9G9E6_9NEOP|nr:hypothetical protein PR048_030312 [Dryococelus australis]